MRVLLILYQQIGLMVQKCGDKRGPESLVISKNPFRKAKWILIFIFLHERGEFESPHTLYPYLISS